MSSITYLRDRINDFEKMIVEQDNMIKQYNKSAQAAINKRNEYISRRTELDEEIVEMNKALSLLEENHFCDPDKQNG